MLLYSSFVVDMARRFLLKKVTKTDTVGLIG
jgi:hypothetical protein